MPTSVVFTPRNMQYLRRCAAAQTLNLQDNRRCRRMPSASRSLARRRGPSRSVLARAFVRSPGGFFRPPSKELVTLGNGEHHAAGDPILHLGNAAANFGRSITPVPGVLYFVDHLSLKKSHAGLPARRRARHHQPGPRPREHPWSQSIGVDWLILRRAVGSAFGRRIGAAAPVGVSAVSSISAVRITVAGVILIRRRRPIGSRVTPRMGMRHSLRGRLRERAEAHY